LLSDVGLEKEKEKERNVLKAERRATQSVCNANWAFL
jgi:hypothetical protein